MFSSDRVLIVEGRADVILLLKAGIENVIAVEGTNIPDSIIRLGKEKKLSAFLDGDRGGDLILRELQQVVHLERVIRAPPGKEVENLSPVEALTIFRQKEQPKIVKEEKVRKEEGRRKVPEDLGSKTKEIFPQIDGTLEAVILDKSMTEINRIPVSELVKNLDSTKDARYVVFDGIITQRLIDAANNSGVKGIVGHRTGEIKGAPSSFVMATFHEIGLE